MNLALVVALVMQLVNTVHIALAADALTEYRQVPYTVNDVEIQGVSALLALGLGTIVATSSTTLSVTNSIARYTAINSKDEAIAQDVFIPEVKENFVFNAANSVRAMVFIDPRLFGWENSKLIELYSRLDDDPDFERIVQKVKSAKALRYTDDALVKQVEQLIQDVAVKYLREKGLLPESESNGSNSNLLSLQSV